jgi:hypothetical protein
MNDVLRKKYPTAQECIKSYSNMPIVGFYTTAVVKDTNLKYADALGELNRLAQEKVIVPCWEITCPDCCSTLEITDKPKADIDDDEIFCEKCDDYYFIDDHLLERFWGIPGKSFLKSRSK